MFDAVLNRHVKGPNRWGRGAIAAAALHGLTAVAVIWASVHAGKKKDDAPTVTFFQATPPPPPPPPPAGGGGSTPKQEKKTETKKIEHKPDTIVESKKKEVLPDPDPPKNDAPAKPDPAGVVGGVEGGVAGGVVGGVVGGTVGGTLGGQLGGKLGGTGANGVVAFGEGMTRPAQPDASNFQYTAQAREAKVAGTLIVKCTIQPDGAYQNCRVIKGLPFMDKVIVDRLNSYKGSPVLFQGHPVAVDYTFTFRLKMPD